MKRLLWKEWQERRVWLLLCAVAIIIIGGLGLEQSPFEFNWNFSAWVSVTIILAVLAGLTGYGSELTGARAVFLYTRALCWQQVLLAKALLGLVVIFGASFIAALVMRLLAPAPYVPFMTPWHLLQGALLPSLLLGSFYLLGLGCSIVLPGLAGGILTLLTLGVATLLGLYLLQYMTNGNAQLLMAFIYLCITPLFTVVILARFGVTLPPLQRLRRFGVVLCSVVAAGIVVGLLPPFQRCENQLMARLIDKQITINPSGNWAFVQNYNWSKGAMEEVRMSLLSLAEQRVLPLPAGKPVSVTWLSDECLLINADTRDHTVLLWVEHGQIRSHEFVALSNKIVTRFILSPNGRKVLIDDRFSLKVFDMATGQSQDVLDKSVADRCWWQSPEIVGYIDPIEGRRVLEKF